MSELVELLKSGSTSNCSDGGEERSSRPLPRPKVPGVLSWWSKYVGLPWPHDNVEGDDDHPPESPNTPRPLVFSFSAIERPAKSRLTSLGPDDGCWLDAGYAAV